MHTQKNSNNLRSHLREIMALDHSRLGLENKFLENNSGRIFCVRQVYLPTNLGACKPTFYTFYIQYFEALFLSYRPRTECSISEFYNTNFILASNLTADNFKKYSTSMGQHLSLRYGQVILVRGYPVLTAVN